MKGRVFTTDAALARAKAAKVDERPAAKTVRYVPAHDIFIVGMSDNTRLGLPREKLQGLQTATRKQLGNLSVEMRGTGLHWEDLNVDLYVPDLMRGVFGTKKWMSELGRGWRQCQD